MYRNRVSDDGRLRWKLGFSSRSTCQDYASGRRSLLRLRFQTPKTFAPNHFGTTSTISRRWRRAARRLMRNSSKTLSGRNSQIGQNGLPTFSPANLNSRYLRLFPRKIADQEVVVAHRFPISPPSSLCFLCVLLSRGFSHARALTQGIKSGSKVAFCTNY